MNSYTTRARSCGVLTLAGFLFVPLVACMSLDADAELDDAERMVAERSGIAVDWSERWSPAAVGSARLRPLSARDAARLALRNHPGIRATVESILQARADYVQAHLLPNPVLNLNLGFSIDSGSGTPAMGTLLQPLAALWQRPAKVDAAAARLRAVVLRVSNAALQLVAEAESAHAELVFAEKDLGLEQQARAFAADTLKLVEQRFAEGEAARLDRNRAALELLDAETKVTRATMRRDSARRSLLEVCGLAGEHEMPVTGGAPMRVPSWVARLVEKDLVQMANGQRLDLRAMRELVAGKMDEVRLAELRRIPDVAGGAVYQRNFQGREAIGPSLRLEIPIFDGGGAKVAKAESVQRAAVAETERVRQAAIGEVRRAFVALQGEIANQERLRKGVLALATQNRELAQQSLDAGVLDRGTVLDLARREVQARLAVNQSALAVVQWFIELERAVGGRVIRPETAKPDGKEAE